MDEPTIKGPLWFGLGVVLVVALLQGLRLLALPETLLGNAIRSAIEVAALFGIVNLCVTPIRRERTALFFAIALPFTFLGHTVWASWVRGLSAQGNDAVILLAAVGLGVGLGGTIVIWMKQGKGGAACASK